jgi:hypothetical protein
MGDETVPDSSEGLWPGLDVWKLPKMLGKLSSSYLLPPPLLL